MEIFHDQVWQMSVGERAALEGMLSQLEPRLAIEIGTAQGASLQRIAAHAEEVHSFDLVAPSLPVPDNVTLHTGDSHERLPRLLERLAAEGRNVDFVLVDGDHTADGVRRDVEDLLDSPAVGRTHIVLHDTSNEEVRRGLDAVRYRRWRKVVYVDLDCVAGHLFAQPGFERELWGGLGLVVVDASRPAHDTPDPVERRFHPTGKLLADVRDRLDGDDGDLGAQVAELAEQARFEREARAALERSFSWRITRPLRTARTRARRLLT